MYLRQHLNNCWIREKNLILELLFQHKNWENHTTYYFRGLFTPLLNEVVELTAEDNVFTVLSADKRSLSDLVAIASGGFFLFSENPRKLPNKRFSEYKVKN